MTYGRDVTFNEFKDIFMETQTGVVDMSVSEMDVSFEEGYRQAVVDSIEMVRDKHAKILIEEMAQAAHISTTTVLKELLKELERRYE